GPNGQPGDEMIRIGNGQGFWGDSPDGPRRLVQEGPLDFLGLDYLAEVTMSIMQKLKSRNPERGYATDFVELMEEILPVLLEKDIRVLANAGGVNQAACRKALMAAARRCDCKGFKIATVSGDDIMDQIPELLAQGIPLASMDDGRPASEILDRMLSANVYLPTKTMVEALDSGARIVLTGRCTDPGLTLAPMVHTFGWEWDDWDRLAAGTVAGHILECGPQCTGGNFSRWWEVRGWDRIGYPLVEAEPDGSFVVTKHPGTGGMVTVDTVAEQLVYEMGDPRRYVTPDVIADFTSIQIRQQGKNRVRVEGIRGASPTDTYKVSISYMDGYKATGQLTVSGPDALAKARICAQALWGRLKRAGVQFAETRTEYLGVDSCHEGIIPTPGDPPEVVLRVGAKDRDRARVERFGRELAPLVTSGPPGVTGFAGGRPKATEAISFWPALIPKDRVNPVVDVLEVA
ncbi:MAG: acyclic terpene utilization AtuA family protein, partial [Acidobacteriota bacterium]